MDTFLELVNGVLQSEALFGLLMAVIGIVATWVAATYADWKKKSGNKEEVETIERWAKLAVSFVEQALGEEDNQVKLAKAKESLKSNLDSRGINIGGRELSEVVEAAVFEVKKVNKEQSVAEVGVVAEQPKEDIKATGQQSLF